jgi:peroxiredoxin
MTLSIGDRAPSFRLRGTDNAYWILGEPDERKSVLVVFFRREVAACRVLLPFVERLYRRAHEHPSEILGIALDSQHDTLEFAADYSFTFPILLESADLATARSFGVQSLPTLLRLDEKLIVREILTGWSREAFEILSRSYLETVGAPSLMIWEPNDQTVDQLDAVSLPEMPGTEPSA